MEVTRADTLSLLWGGGIYIYIEKEIERDSVKENEVFTQDF